MLSKGRVYWQHFIMPKWTGNVCVNGNNFVVRYFRYWQVKKIDIRDDTFVMKCHSNWTSPFQIRNILEIFLFKVPFIVNKSVSLINKDTPIRSGRGNISATNKFRIELIYIRLDNLVYYFLLWGEALIVNAIIWLVKIVIWSIVHSVPFLKCFLGMQVKE